MENIIESIVASVVTSSAVIWVFKSWIGERLKQSIKNEYDQKIENFKIQLKMEFDDEVRKRQLYEQLSVSIEEMFSEYQEDNRKLSLTFNKLFGLLALYAPDDVYRSIRKSLEGYILPREAKPIIYAALRKDLLKSNTKIQPGDLIQHYEARGLTKEETDEIVASRQK